MSDKVSKITEPPDPETIIAECLEGMEWMGAFLKAKHEDALQWRIDCAASEYGGSEDLDYLIIEDDVENMRKIVEMTRFGLDLLRRVKSAEQRLSVMDGNNSHPM